MGDWYRSPEWGDEAERQFRERLARARPTNRIQYRRIKAIALIETVEPLVTAPWGDKFGMVTDPYGVLWLVNIAGDQRPG